MTAPVPPVDLDQLETAYEAWEAGGWGAVEFSLFGAPQAIPALIAELRDLRAKQDAVQAVLETDLWLAENGEVVVSIDDLRAALNGCS